MIEATQEMLDTYTRAAFTPGVTLADRLQLVLDIVDRDYEMMPRHCAQVGPGGLACDRPVQHDGTRHVSLTRDRGFVSW